MDHTASIFIFVKSDTGLHWYPVYLEHMSVEQHADMIAMCRKKIIPKESRNLDDSPFHDLAIFHIL